MLVAFVNPAPLLLFSCIMFDPRLLLLPTGVCMKSFAVRPNPPPGLLEEVELAVAPAAVEDVWGAWL